MPLRNGDDALHDNMAIPLEGGEIIAKKPRRRKKAEQEQEVETEERQDSNG
jgi:hypothetical protein